MRAQEAEYVPEISSRPRRFSQYFVIRSIEEISIEELTDFRGPT